MYKYFYKKIHYKYLKNKLQIEEILKLKNKYSHLKNTPYQGLSKKHRNYFRKIKILRKDISVLKYTDYNRQLKRAFEIYFLIQKNFKNYKSILDLGCGVGYFLYINKYFKKEAFGIDWYKSNKYYNENSIEFIKEYNKILDIKPINYKINNNFNPKIIKKFDLITAFSANFDGVYKNRYKFKPWSYDEYEMFFKKIKNYLKPGGKFFIKFNSKWEYKQNFIINNQFKKHLIKKKMWYGNGIITNLTPTKDLIKYF